MPLAAVTGATGFLGRRIVGVLRGRGFDVRVLARGPTGDAWAGTAVEIVRGDLADREALARLCAGAEVVAHAAGLVKARSRQEFFEVNVEGTRRVCAAADPAAPVVLVSSLSAREPHLSDYAASKRAAEDVARGELGPRLAILRPPAIYGPGDKATRDLFRAAAISPVLPIPDAPRARLALVHVDDAAAAVADLAQTPPRAGPFVAGGARPAGYAWREIAQTLCAAAGRRPAIAPIPAWALLGAGALAQAFARLTGSPSMLTLGKAREILHGDWSVDPAFEAPGDRGPPVDLLTGFTRTIAAYRADSWRA